MAKCESNLLSFPPFFKNYFVVYTFQIDDESPNNEKVAKNKWQHVIGPANRICICVFACDGALARATRRVEAEVAADTRSIARGHYQSAF